MTVLYCASKFLCYCMYLLGSPWVTYLLLKLEPEVSN